MMAMIDKCTVISLTNLSLNLITENFKRFHYASLVPISEKLKRNLEFLQRRYSSELCSELYRMQDLKDAYLDFLLNEHLEFLDERWLEKGSYRGDTKLLLCSLPNLTKIFCFRVTDDILETIGKFCPKIVEIEAEFCYVNEGIKYLCENKNGDVPCPKIRKLFNCLHTISNEDLKCVIRNLKCLEEITHRNFPQVLYSLHKRDLPELENAPRYNFIRLNLGGISEFAPYYTDLLKICLTLCPKLKSLCCSISDEEQLGLFDNIYLENLKISFTKLNPKINVDNFLKNSGCNVVNLTLYYCEMSVPQLAVSCPKLYDFYAEDVSFMESCDDSNVMFQNLVHSSFCDIESNEVNDKAISLFLLYSPNLKDLKFNDCPFSSEKNTYFLRCQNNSVKELFIGSYKVKLSFFTDILPHYPSLETLYLEKYCYASSEKHTLNQFAKMTSNKLRVIFN